MTARDSRFITYTTDGSGPKTVRNRFTDPAIREAEDRARDEYVRASQEAAERAERERTDYLNAAYSHVRLAQGLAASARREASSVLEPLVAARRGAAPVLDEAEGEALMRRAVELMGASDQFQHIANWLAAKYEEAAR